MLFLVVMLVLDGIYLYATRKASMDLIRRMQGPEKSPMRLGGAVFTYACMGALLYGFILRPKRSILEAFLLGFFVYGVYEGTNYTIFTQWPLSFAVRDTLWGGSLFALTTWIVRKFKTFSSF